MRTDPRPTAGSMGFFYAEDYGPHQDAPVAPPSPAGSGWKRWLRSHIDFRVEPLPPVSPGRVLEIGCGNGSFLRHLAGRGWTVAGIEASERAAAASRALGLDVTITTVEDADAPRFPLDLIAGWMVLEHLHEPVAALRKMRSWVAPGGWLTLSTPNAGSLEFRAFRGDWYALQLPTHLYHFTPETIAKVLDASGWRVERIIHQRVLTNAVASAALALERHGVFPRAVDDLRSVASGSGRAPYLLYPLATLLAVFGQTGRMAVWARPMV